MLYKPKNGRLNIQKVMLGIIEKCCNTEIYCLFLRGVLNEKDKMSSGIKRMAPNFSNREVASETMFHQTKVPAKGENKRNFEYRGFMAQSYNLSCNFTCQCH